jgi:hypothetical protein
MLQAPIPDSSETGETGVVRRPQVGVRSSEHFGLQAVSLGLPFPLLARTQHLTLNRHE